PVQAWRAKEEVVLERVTIPAGARIHAGAREPALPRHAARAGPNLPLHPQHVLPSAAPLAGDLVGREGPRSDFCPQLRGLTLPPAISILSASPPHRRPPIQETRMQIHLRQAVVGSLLAAATSVAFAQAKEITVGVFNAMTGNYAFGGVPIQNGIKLALEEANTQGLPGGNKFKIVEADTAGEKSQVINLVNQFAKRDNAMLILGPTVSPEALAGAPVANDLQVPILVIGSSPAIVATGPWAFKIQA